MAGPRLAEVKFGGFLVRRECWHLSWAARSFLLLICLTAAIVYAQNAPAFLAPTRRVETRVLVVEGWVRDYVIRAAVKEFHDGHYDQVYTTGGPVTGSDGATNDFNTMASIGAERLIKNGLTPGQVQMVPARKVQRDRTYSSALALHDWFQQHGLIVSSFNVLTEDAHARRSQLLFRKAFGDHTEIGIISIPDPDYDVRRWWHYSEGVRQILDESIAYFYAAWLFRPPPG